MEPDREKEQKALETSAAQKPKRFRIVKLEERIAPSKGGHGTHNSCACGTLNGVTCPGPGDTGACVTTTAFC